MKPRARDDEPENGIEGPLDSHSATATEQQQHGGGAARGIIVL
jgi:hypothetical protein